MNMTGLYWGSRVAKKKKKNISDRYLDKDNAHESHRSQTP